MLRHPIFTLNVAAAIGVALIGIGVPLPFAVLIVVAGVTLLGLAWKSSTPDSATIKHGHYDRYLAGAPQDAETYFLRGLTRYGQGDMAGAINDYDRTIAFDPKKPIVYTNRGVARRFLGDLAGAISDYNQAITLDPKMAIAYYNRASARLKQLTFTHIFGGVSSSTLNYGRVKWRK